MEFSVQEIRNAYLKLKSYIYYDHTDLVLRRQIVEFETSIGKDWLTNNPSSHYSSKKGIALLLEDFSLEDKLERITKEINNYHKDSEFFDGLLKKISIDYYPKKIKAERKSDHNDNFISNKRIRNSYEIEKLTPFINAPIELHIISVLWILTEGYRNDANLRSESLGNRLLLNKDKTSVVQGSGLFKPYYNQYQKWRDDAVETAVNIINKGKNVAFLNLDIKEYFNSVKIPRSELFNVKGVQYKVLQPEGNLKKIFLDIHIQYTEILKRAYKKENELKKEFDVALPIGLVSSYVLANHYLNKFDDAIAKKVKPAYYGRYVDDLIFVIIDPETGFSDPKSNEESIIENFIQDIFSGVISVISPEKIVDHSKSKEPESNLFKLEGYDSLFCQPEKSLLHYFDAEESHLVIDRLKKELDERTSEFRDFPEEGSNKLSLASSAYHLDYDGTEGKIRTLKDYKENRFGLTLFLSNKIFSALRHQNNLTDKESEEVVRFFKGETCLTFYRFWERIFTLLLVNQKPAQYIDFLFHCYQQIERLNIPKESWNMGIDNVKNSLYEYLDSSNEITLSLDLDFLSKTKKVERDFQFKKDALSRFNFRFLFGLQEPTDSKSYWITRFRQANMMRHNYVVHPLLTYTKASKEGKLRSLVSIKTEFDKYRISKELLTNSPRRVKFWECCLSVIYDDLGKWSRKRTTKGDYYTTDIFSIIKEKESKEIRDYMDAAFDRFAEINQSHVANYEQFNEAYRDKFFKRRHNEKQNSPSLYVEEITVDSKKRLPKKIRIAFANTEVKVSNVILGMRGTPNLNSKRYDSLASILNTASKENSNLLLFPECFIPVNLLSSLAKYSEKNDVAIIAGTEHVRVNDIVFNFVVTILPIEVDGVSDAVVSIRLKNHYSHEEQSMIKGDHLKVPLPKIYRHDIFNWRNLYFSPYYCFELANVWHRSLFKSKLDMLIAVEWNKDTNYFSNIVESCARDLHCYIAQVNTSQYGDSRLTQPTETARMDLLRLKGGLNDTILIAEIELDGIREFQRKTYEVTKDKREYKPLPPDYDHNFVLKRINNESIL
jgi:hypothetical protein